MEKIWYIDIQGKREGPFSFFDLRRDDRINPDTLVWKKGFSNWKPIRDVPELKEVFADEKPHEDEEKPEDEGRIKPILPQDEIVLDLQKGPPYFFWFFFFLIAVAYFLSQLLWMRS